MVNLPSRSSSLVSGNTAEVDVAVKVHMIRQDDFEKEVFENFAKTHTDFDILAGDNLWIGRGAEKGLYLELTHWLPKAVDLKTMHPQVAKHICQYPQDTGRLHAVPYVIDPIGFAYRKDWFEDPNEVSAFRAMHMRDLKVPETWEEFRQVADFFTRSDESKYGCALLTGRTDDSLTMGYQPFMWSFGGWWGQEKTHQVQGYVNGDASVSGLQFMKLLLDFAPEGSVSFSRGAATGAFVGGSTAMAMAYFTSFPDLVKEMGDKVAFFVVPGSAGRRAAGVGGRSFAISTRIPSPRQQQAKRFLSWFLQETTQAKWVQTPGAFTANTNILAGEQFRQATAYNRVFAESLEHLKGFWNIPAYRKLLAASQVRIGEALDDVKSPKEALDKLAEEHEQVLRDAELLR